jgi:UDP-2-acetamido-2,6-beta-L-arabino-hexul-4-ose reductase
LRILITGANGFIARNLRVRLRELKYDDVDCVTRATTGEQLADCARRADFVFHLAGVNRPPDPADFATGNAGFTRRLCATLRDAGRRIPVAYASSIHAERDDPYGRSKLAAEQALEGYGAQSGAAVWIFRLANVFGKWSRPDYNSAIATFCHRIARDMPICVNDGGAPLRLVYIDDVISAFTALLVGSPPSGFVSAQPEYQTTVGEVAGLLQSFVASRASLQAPRAGTGLVRALYSTYVSFLPKESFSYAVSRYEDPRGVFVEMLKTPEYGQFSYFTAHPGIARGEHYHHTKTEKFLVIRGTARFGFRNVDSGETHEIVVRGDEGCIVESIPGWAHNVVNVGDDELIIMLWANEVLDRARPDTVALKVKQ